MKSPASFIKPVKPLGNSFNIIPVILLLLLFLTFIGAQIYFVVEVFLERY